MYVIYEKNHKNTIHFFSMVLERFFTFLSLRTFCPAGRFVLRTFCLRGRFVPEDTLSQWTFCPKDVLPIVRFASGCFISGSFIPLDVLSRDVLSIYLLYIYSLTACASQAASL